MVTFWPTSPSTCRSRASAWPFSPARKARRYSSRSLLLRAGISLKRGSVGSTWYSCPARIRSQLLRLSSTATASGSLISERYPYLVAKTRSLNSASHRPRETPWSTQRQGLLGRYIRTIPRVRKMMASSGVVPCLRAAGRLSGLVINSSAAAASMEPVPKNIRLRPTAWLAV